MNNDCNGRHLFRFEIKFYPDGRLAFLRLTVGSVGAVVALVLTLTYATYNSRPGGCALAVSPLVIRLSG